MVVEHRLSDRQCLGSTSRFSAEQICQLIGLACEKPPGHLSHWSYDDLVREALRQRIVKPISKTTIGRLLKSGQPQATLLLVKS